MNNEPYQYLFYENQKDCEYLDEETRKGNYIEGYTRTKQGQFGIIGDNLDSLQELRRTLRHEMVGHFGYSTFNAADRSELANRIVDKINTENSDINIFWRNHIEKSDVKLTIFLARTISLSGQFNT